VDLQFDTERLPLAARLRLNRPALWIYRAMVRRLARRARIT